MKRDQLTDDPISCPNCSRDVCLQFLPMLGGTVYVQCLCGFGWEIQRKPEFVN